MRNALQTVTTVKFSVVMGGAKTVIEFMFNRNGEEPHPQSARWCDGREKNRAVNHVGYNI